MGDRRYFFMGSFNWDPRSADLNTELGIIIDSEVLVGPLVDALYAATPERAYQVFLDDAGKLRWKTTENGTEYVLDKEPDTGFWTRFFGGMTRVLPIKSQL